mmetsp:Transcript_36278/g.76209  ORF Transcript_36278/g.76209 Transcript_36278/m.76209 type:complete len:230 (-) Transcript_36278:331-1020(-)
MHVPIRLLPRLPHVGPHPSRLPERIPPRRPIHQIESPHGVHHGRPRPSSRVRRTQRHGRGELPVRAQEAPFEATRSGPHQGDHAEGEPRGHVPGRVHGRGGVAGTRGELPVLPSDAGREKAGGDRVHEAPSEDDHGEDAEAVQAAGEDGARGTEAHDEGGRAGGARAGGEIPGEVQAERGVQRGGIRALVAAAEGGGKLVREHEEGGGKGGGHGLLQLLSPAFVGARQP